MGSFRRWASAALAFALVAGLAQAQDWPSKPIRMIVPYPPGGGTDIVARIVNEKLSPELGQPIVIDNKGGAGGSVGTEIAAKAAPDGYTVLITTNTTHAANEHLYKKLSYDPVKDFAPITLVSTGQMLLLVRPDSPYKTLADLIAAAKKAPGKLSFGAGSSSSQVASELLKQMAHVDALYVPYKSNPLALTDLIGGQIDFMFADAPTALPQVQGGKLRALAASGSKRVAAAPDVPTVAEAGVKGYDMSYWFAIYAPAGTPAAIVNKLNQAFAKATTSEGFKNFMAKTSGEVSLSTPEGLAQFQAADSKKWGQVIRAAGIKPE